MRSISKPGLCAKADEVRVSGHDGKIVLLTMAAWAYIQRNDMANWTVIIDEIPKVFEITQLNCPSVYEQLYEFCEIGEEKVVTLGFISIIPISRSSKKSEKQMIRQ